MFPEIDAEDYCNNPDRSEPVETPKYLYCPYYLGDNGKWIMSFPSFFKKNALQTAKIYAASRPVKLLTFKLDKITKIKPPKQRKIRRIKK
jgi:hypothetical protein